MKGFKVNKKRVAIAGAAVLAMSAAGYGVAYATIPDAGGTIHGCYVTSGPKQGDLRVIDTDAGGSCPSNTTALDWPSSRSVLATQRIVSAVKEVAPGDDGFAAAACPDGWRLTGGGFAQSDGGPLIILGSYAVRPLAGQQWDVDVRNSTADQAGIAAVAECAQLQ